MTLLHSFLNAVRSWRRRRSGPKANRRATVALERLDHRQLLSVNFTGNVISDFPTPSGTGYVRLAAQIPPDQIARPDNTVEPLIKTSGFAIDAIWVSYDPADDTLNIGLEQPDNQRTGQPVIAGDADNNLNSATTDPALAVIPGFVDFADLLVSERMGVFLDLDGAASSDPQADVIAGFPQFPAPIPPAAPAPKPYRVAQALNGPPGTEPQFGAPLPQNTGNVYLVNDPAHPNLEFVIKDFSDLYLAETGETLKPNSELRIGAFGGSLNDPGVSNTFIDFKGFLFQDVIRPPVCPVDPPILVNPHEQYHINTAHPSDVRVYVFGSADFDVREILPETVTLDGARPILPLPTDPRSLIRNINKDPYEDAVFFFRGSDINLPSGVQTITLTGLTTDFTVFTSTAEVYIRGTENLTPHQISAQQYRRELWGNGANLTPLQRQFFHNLHSNTYGSSVDLLMDEDPMLVQSALRSQATDRLGSREAPGRPRIVAQSNQDLDGPTVRIPLRQAASVGLSPEVNVVSRSDRANRGLTGRPFWGGLGASSAASGTTVKIPTATSPAMTGTPIRIVTDGATEGKLDMGMAS